jgi:hypothetical protein
VTKEYGRYFGSCLGLAAAAVGVWLLGSEWAVSAFPRAGRLLFAVGPVVGLGFASWARRYYQRHGEVITEGELSGLPGELTGRWLRVLALSAIFCTAVRAIVEQLERPRSEYEFVVIAAFVATPMLAIRFARGYHHLVLVAMLSAFALSSFRSPDDWSASVVTIGIAFVVLGIWDHGRYRRLERRLRALKGSA